MGMGFRYPGKQNKDSFVKELGVCRVKEIVIGHPLSGFCVIIVLNCISQSELLKSWSDFQQKNI